LKTWSETLGLREGFEGVGGGVGEASAGYSRARFG
jgi:hypothetical protein